MVTENFSHAHATKSFNVSRAFFGCSHHDKPNQINQQRLKNDPIPTDVFEKVNKCDEFETYLEKTAQVCNVYTHGRAVLHKASLLFQKHHRVGNTQYIHHSLRHPSQSSIPLHNHCKPCQKRLYSIL